MKKNVTEKAALQHLHPSVAIRPLVCSDIPTVYTDRTSLVKTDGDVPVGVFHMCGHGHLLISLSITRRPLSHTAQQTSTPISFHSAHHKLRVMNQTTPVLLSLFISFINPKYCSGRRLAESTPRKKTACSRYSQWEASSTLAPSLSLSLLLSCSLFNPLNFVHSPSPSSQCILAVITTEWLRRAKCGNKNYISGRGQWRHGGDNQRTLSEWMALAPNRP